MSNYSLPTACFPHVSKPTVMVQLQLWGLSKLNDLINELLFRYYEWLQTKESSGSSQFPCCAFKILSGFTSVVVNNTFTNTLNPVRFNCLSVTPKVQSSEISKREETQQITQLFGWVLSASATKTPFIPPAAALCVLIIKHQHLAAAVNISRPPMPPVPPWEPGGHCLSPWCGVWWKRDGTKSPAGFTCCGFVELRQGNWGWGRPRKVGYR